MSDVEYKTVSLPVDQNLHAAAQALEAEGWQLIPGAQPLQIYYLWRNKPKPVEPEKPLPTSLGKLLVNDSLITVRKAGS